MQEPFDVSMVREVMIRRRPGSDAPSGRGDSRFVKHVGRLLCWVTMVCHPGEFRHESFDPQQKTGWKRLLFVSR